MAQNEAHFKSCHYSFLNRMLQPFQKHGNSSHATTLQVNALVEGKSAKRAQKSDTKQPQPQQLFSKSTVDLKDSGLAEPLPKEERMSIRQIGQCLADEPPQTALNRPTSISTVTRPRITGVFSRLLSSVFNIVVVRLFSSLLIPLSVFVSLQLKMESKLKRFPPLWARRTPTL